MGDGLRPRLGLGFRLRRGLRRGGRLGLGGGLGLRLCARRLGATGLFRCLLGCGHQKSILRRGFPRRATGRKIGRIERGARRIVLIRVNVKCPCATEPGPSRRFYVRGCRISGKPALRPRRHDPAPCPASKGIPSRPGHNQARLAKRRRATFGPSSWSRSCRGSHPWRPWPRGT